MNFGSINKTLPANQRKMQSIDESRLEGILHFHREPRWRRIVYRMKYVKAADALPVKRIRSGKRRLISWRQWFGVDELMLAGCGHLKASQCGRHVLKVAQTTGARWGANRFGLHGVRRH